MRLSQVLSRGQWTDDDATQFGGSVAEAAVEIRMQFIRKVYSIL